VFFFEFELFKDDLFVSLNIRPITIDEVVVGLKFSYINDGLTTLVDHFDYFKSLLVKYSELRLLNFHFLFLIFWVGGILLPSLSC